MCRALSLRGLPPCTQLRQTSSVNGFLIDVSRLMGPVWRNQCVMLFNTAMPATQRCGEYLRCLYDLPAEWMEGGPEHISQVLTQLWGLSHQCGQHMGQRHCPVTRNSTLGYSCRLRRVKLPTKINQCLGFSRLLPSLLTSGLSLSPSPISGMNEDRSNSLFFLIKLSSES